MLIAWGGEQVLNDAQAMIDKGLVLAAEYEAPFIRGTLLWSNREFNTALKMLPDGTVESQCPCWANRERGIICSHVIAVALSLVRRNTDPQREAKFQEEARRARKLAQVKEAEYIQRTTEESAGATPASVSLILPPDWPSQFPAGKVALACGLSFRGRTVPLESVPRDIMFGLNKHDDAILYVLEDICAGPAKNTVELSRFDLLNLLSTHTGKPLKWQGHEDLTINSARMVSHLKMDIDRKSGEILLRLHTELPFTKDGDAPLYFVEGRNGWALAAGNLWPLETVLPLPYHSLYAQDISIPRTDVLAFIQKELPSLMKSVKIESDITADLFSFEPAQPGFRLLIKGSPAALAATLYSKYSGIELIAAKPDPNGLFGLPDPSDLMRYLIRNPAAEKQALELLSKTGLSGESGDDLTHISGTREVLNFLGGHLPVLRRRGWQVELQGRIAPHFDDMGFVTPVVHIEDGGSSGWFDVSFEFEDGTGQSLTHSEIQTALRKGEFHVRRGEKTFLIDADAVSSMLDVFSDCASADGEHAGHFRLSDVYAPFVKSSLDALDGVDVEPSQKWRSRAEQFNRITKVGDIGLGAQLDGILRPYQKDGVKWLRFLEANGFCGILADEMGLGKTVQTLAWLTLERVAESARGKPTLIVCPTSIVENWAEEAQRFAPRLKVLVLSGADRHESWDKLRKSDVVVTSYALLRRDIEKYLEQEMSIMILDEAQHIKNRSTQNAVAAKQVKALHKLVLTGTPMENSVSDLWSILDFLMPGYMGRHDIFKAVYEQPIQRGGPQAEIAQSKLRRKLQPFLLRRLKRDVAKDLPPKIQRTVFCSLTQDQRMVYNQILLESQRKISDMVAKQGFNKCRMQILATLMRLRQICCHLDLLDLKGLKSEYPSAKTDMFFELVDEALDSGHRILVFSQFVSMLTILRNKLDSEKTAYCYLDGSTQNRMEVVHQFNSNKDIPLFLISLKAGGTGLNLTGADMVVHFDPWWNPAVEDQATDRAYRIGQQRTVYSIKLITRNTVEEKVLALQEKKRSIISATVESEDAMIDRLSWDDIKEILSL